MAISITVSNTSGSATGVHLSVSGQVSENYYTIYRTTASGHYGAVVVQGYTGTTYSLVPGDFFGAAISDYRCPFGETITYTIEEFDSSDLDTPIDSDSDTYDPTVVPLEGFNGNGAAMISNPLELVTDGSSTYTRHVTGTIVDFGPLTRSANILGRHQVLGRNNPIISSDKMGNRKGSVTIINISSITQTVGGDARTADYDVIDFEESYGWPALFEDGYTLLFRSYWRDTGIDDFYFKPLSISSERSSRVVGSQGGSQMSLIYTIEFEEVDGTILVDPGEVAPTWAVVAANNATWADVASKHATWADMLADPSA